MIVWFGLDFMWFVVNFDFKRFPQRHWFDAVRLLHILLATTDLKKKITLYELIRAVTTAWNTKSILNPFKDLETFGFAFFTELSKPVNEQLGYKICNLDV